MCEADALQVGGAPRPDAFQVLKRRRERVHRSWRAHVRSRAPGAPHCTMVAVALPTRISRMRGGKLERVVHVDAGGVLRGARVVAEQLLQQGLRDGDAGDLRGLELERPTPSFVDEPARRGERQPAGQVAQRIGPAALLLFAHGVEIDDGPAADAAVAERVERRIDDADRDLRPRVVLEVGVQLVVGDLRGRRLGCDRLGGLDGLALPVWTMRLSLAENWSASCLVRLAKRVTDAPITASAQTVARRDLDTMRSL